jgi:hypothetical protein
MGPGRNRVARRLRNGCDVRETAPAPAWVTGGSAGTFAGEAAHDRPQLVGWPIVYPIALLPTASGRGSAIEPQ